MPKRKRHDDVEKVEKKLRKIEKMLKKCKRRKRGLSSSSESPSLSPKNQNDGENQGLMGDGEEIDSVFLGESQQHDNITEPVAPLVASEIPESATIQPVQLEDDAIQTAEDIGESGLDKDVLEILGDDPTVVAEFGKDIRAELATRFNHIATNGLSKDCRKELCEKYLIPGNCTMIGAPSLNTEVKVALNENTLKRDKLIEYRQKRLAAAISCLGEAVSYALDAKEKDNLQIKRLMDAARLMCDAQYNDSISRRNLAVSSLKKEAKEPLLNTKIGKSLFGEDLSDSLKAAKAVTKSATELKNQSQPKPTSMTTVQTKNWRAPFASRRQPAMGRRNTPAAPMTPAQPLHYRATEPPQPRSARNTSSRRPPPPPQRYTNRRY